MLCAGQSTSITERPEHEFGARVPRAHEAAGVGDAIEPGIASITLEKILEGPALARAARAARRGESTAKWPTLRRSPRVKIVDFTMCRLGFGCPP